MNKRILALAVGLACANVFATSFTLNLNQMVKHAAFENDYEWKDGKQTTNVLGYKFLLNLSSKLNGTLPRKGDSITVTWDGYASGNVSDLTMFVVDNSAAANWWRDLTGWDQYLKVGNLNNNQTFTVSHTFILSDDAADIKGVCLIIKAATNASGLATLVSSNAPAAAPASSNKTHGIDLIALAPLLGNASYYVPQKTDYSKSGYAGTIEWIRVQTYDCFLNDNKFGVFGEIGLGGFSFEGMDVFAFELSVGPAFGMNIEDSSRRFQVAAGLHYFKFDMDYSDSGESASAQLPWIGVFVNPQIRFTTNKTCSFIIGLELSADFYGSGTLKNDSQRYTINCNSFIALTPYLGLGINF